MRSRQRIVTGADGERLYVRVDATPASGLGHCMRCLALAQAWQDAGGSVCVIGRHAAHTIDRLASENVERIAIATDADLAHDLETTLAAIPEGAPIVLDGYDFDPGYQRALAAHGRLLMIDDMGQWPSYAGALLLNQNPHAAAVRYEQAPAQRLLGCDYTLLSRDFAAARSIDSSVPEARRWVVSLGGTDPNEMSTAILSALAASAPETEIRFVVGPLAHDRSELDRAVKDHANIVLVESPADMLGVLQSADLGISAAGTTSLQLARLGVPTLLIAIADNQEPLGRSLDQAGASLYLGRWPRIDAKAIAAAAVELAADVSRRTTLGESGRRLIDGRGAARVAAALAATARATK